MYMFIFKAHELKKGADISKSKHTSILKGLEDGVDKKKVKNLWMLSESGKTKYLEATSGVKKVKEVVSFIGKQALSLGGEDESGKLTHRDGWQLDNLAFMTQGGKIFFNPKVISENLGINTTWTRERVNKMEDDLKKRFTHQELIELEYSKPSPNGAVLLTEEGLYEFIATYQSPKTRPFRKWVFGAVLPTLRKDGNYYVGDEDLRKESVDELDYAIKVLDRALTASRTKFEKVMPKEDNYRILNYLLTAIDHTKDSCGIMSDMYTSILEKDRIIDVERSSNATYGDIKIKMDTLFKQHGAILDSQFLPKGKIPTAETYRTIFRIADLLSNGKMFKTSVKKGQVKTEAYFNAGFGKQIYEAIEIVIDRLNNHGMIWG